MYLRTRREEAGLSLRALARKLEISAPFLSHVERGFESPLGPEYWPRLLRALPNLDADKLLDAFLAGKLQPGKRVDLRAFLKALKTAGGPVAQMKALEQAVGRATKVH